MRPLQAQAEPRPADEVDSDIDVSDEDVQFVDEYAESLGFLKALKPAQLERCAASFTAHTRWSACLCALLQPRC